MSDDSRDSSVVLFGERSAGVYLMTDIYDPDLDGDNPAEAQGKIVPGLGSQVVKIVVAASGVFSQLYTVIAVNPDTLKSTLEPTGVLPKESENDTRIVSYGNSLFMLYYAPVNIVIDGGQTISLTKLVIDNKFSVFGSHAAQYRLSKISAQGVTTNISIGYSSSGINTGAMVDMVATASPGVRKCGGCYTTYPLTKGDVIMCSIFDAANMLIATVNLVAQNAHYLNEINAEANPIVGFDVIGNQFDEVDSKLFLLAGQSVDELAIYPRLTYANNGLTQLVAIDGLSGFVYGLEDINTSTVGMEYPLTIKYYVNNDIVSDLIENDGDDRFITTVVMIKIISATTFNLAKISISPVWDSGTNAWTLHYRGYRSDRADMNGPITGNFVTLTGFTGTLFNTAQTVTLSVSGAETYAQTTILELRDYRLAVAGGVRWLIRDIGAPESDTYGDNTGVHIRPCIKYNTGLANYIIPTTGASTIAVVANSTQTAEEVFLENFYFKAAPPLLGAEAVAPTPTYFRVVNPTTGAGVSQIKAVGQWNSNLMLTYTGISTQYVGGTLLIEFLTKNGDGTYNFLFGAPVDVLSA